MKSFYEMLIILEGRRNYGGTNIALWLASGYDDKDDPPIVFSTILGEGDSKADFSVPIGVSDGHWEATGPLWALDYVPNGTENPASQPIAYTAGQKDEHGVVSRTTGTEFMKPGKRLELLPLSIRADAIKWVDEHVEEAIKDFIENPDDGRPERPDDR
jgi:hypothetical protein